MGGKAKVKQLSDEYVRDDRVKAVNKKQHPDMGPSVFEIREQWHTLFI